MFEESPERAKAIRAFFVFSFAFFSISIGLCIYLGVQRGYRIGPWESGSSVTWSCYTPGGPYYLPNKPRSEQPCPSPTSMNMKSRLPLPTVTPGSNDNTN